MNDELTPSQYFDLHDKLLTLFTIVERYILTSDHEGIPSDLVQLGERLRGETQKKLFD